MLIRTHITSFAYSVGRVLCILMKMITRVIAVENDLVKFGKIDRIPFNDQLCIVKLLHSKVIQTPFLKRKRGRVTVIIIIIE